MARFFLFVSLLSLVSTLFVSEVSSTSFTFTNNCSYTVWPGLLAGAGTTPLSTTGFVLQNGESMTLTTPASWSGRFCGRTLCSQNSTGLFSYLTGDCGSGKVECAGSGAAPPATLAEFTLNGAGGLDFYDVSLVGGYNVPMLVVAQGGTGGNCTSTGCSVDLNAACPSGLKVASTDGSSTVACKSACEAFGAPQYCCSGAFATPDTCTPSSYSQFFKNSCPPAYSYAYDDSTSTFTCAGADYIITFCPSISTTNKGSSAGHYPEVVSPIINMGISDVNSTASTHGALGYFFAGGAAVILSAAVVAALLINSIGQPTLAGNTFVFPKVIGSISSADVTI